MEDSIRLRILRRIGNVHERSANSKLDQKIFTELKDDLSVLARYFKLSPAQSLFVGIIFSKTCHGKTVSLDELIEHFNCWSTTLLEYIDDIDFLHSKGVFFKMSGGHHLFNSTLDYEYFINPKIVEDVLHNNPCPEINQLIYSDMVDLLENIGAMLEQRVDNNKKTAVLLRTVNNLMESNSSLKLVKEAREQGLSNANALVFFYLIWRAISGHQSIDLGRLTEMIFDTASERMKFVQSILGEDNLLLHTALIEVEQSDYFDDTCLKLSVKSHKLLKACGLTLFNTNKLNNNIVQPSAILKKTLIIDDNDMRQYHLVKELLRDENLDEVQKRLTEKGLPKGITILFHGHPGTGKTESALQMARETDRMIMRIDISESKSAWFGESEKRIKKIFNDYRSFMEDCDQTPILLLNEADAIISKRSQLTVSNVKQTENAMQNILLEELENFEGIIIATTNLIKNFDAAFERRFLFKVEFRKPTASIKAKIWKLKLPDLSIFECESLASMFDFSGGQIENVVRKNEVHEIIHGCHPEIKKIIEFCKEESWDVERKKIGYIKDQPYVKT